MESMDKEDGGVEILRFRMNEGEDLDEDDSGGMSWVEWLGDRFGYEGEGWFGEGGKVKELEKV